MTMITDKESPFGTPESCSELKQQWESGGCNKDNDPDMTHKGKKGQRQERQGQCKGKDNAGVGNPTKPKQRTTTMASEPGGKVAAASAARKARATMRSPKRRARMMRNERCCFQASAVSAGWLVAIFDKASKTMSLDSEIRLLRLVSQKPVNHYNKWGAARGGRVGRARSDAKMTPQATHKNNLKE